MLNKLIFLLIQSRSRNISAEKCFLTIVGDMAESSTTANLFYQRRNQAMIFKDYNIQLKSNISRENVI